MSSAMKTGIGVGIVLLAAVIILLIYMAKKGKNESMQDSNTTNPTAQGDSADSSTNSAVKAVYHKITPQVGKEMMEKDRTIILIDVRTQEEYDQGRIAGSILIPDYDIGAKAAAKLPDKNAKIIVYCRSGNRSKTAANKLVSMGYTNVYDMGGISSWPYGTVK